MSPRCVAVYGTLRVGERAADVWAERAEYLGLTTLAGWELRSNGWFPYAIWTGDDADVIVVEVIRPTDDCLAALDRYEGVPILYRREVVDLIAPLAITDENPLGWVEAWIYTPNIAVDGGTRIEDLPLVPGGDWTRRNGVPRFARRT